MVVQGLWLAECIVGESLEVQVLRGQGLDWEGMDLVGVAGNEVGLVLEVGEGKGRVGIVEVVWWWIGVLSK